MIRLVLILGLFGAWQAPVVSDAAETNRLRVIATILPVYCIAANVGGELADVRYLVGSGGDAHDYQLTPRDRSAIEKAQLVLMNGLGVEPWLKRLVSATGRATTVVELADGLGSALIPDETPHHHHEHGAKEEPHAHVEEGFNSHVWLDPVLMCHMVTNAMRAFQRLDPVHADQYARNAVAYVDRLKRLDATMAEGLKSVQGISFVTYHNAFPYFARRYGLQVAGVIEEVPDVDPTPRHLGRLAAEVRRQNAKAIFVEPRHSKRLATRLGQDLKLKVGTLDTLETGTASVTAYEEGMKEIFRSLQTTLK